MIETILKPLQRREQGFRRFVEFVGDDLFGVSNALGARLSDVRRPRRRARGGEFFRRRGIVSKRDFFRVRLTLDVFFPRALAETLYIAHLTRARRLFRLDDCLRLLLRVLGALVLRLQDCEETARAPRTGGRSLVEGFEFFSRVWVTRRHFFVFARLVVVLVVVLVLFHAHQAHATRVVLVRHAHVDPIHAHLDLNLNLFLDEFFRLLLPTRRALT